MGSSRRVGSADLRSHSAAEARRRRRETEPPEPSGGSVSSTIYGFAACLRRRWAALDAGTEARPAALEPGPRVLPRLVTAREGGNLGVVDALIALRRALAVE